MNAILPLSRMLPVEKTPISGSLVLPLDHSRNHIATRMKMTHMIILITFVKPRFRYLIV